MGLGLHARVLPLLVRHLRQAAGPRAQDQGRDLDLLGPDLEATDDNLEPLVLSGPSLKRPWALGGALESCLVVSGPRVCALTCWRGNRNVKMYCVARDARVCEVCTRRRRHPTPDHRGYPHTFAK